MAQEFDKSGKWLLQHHGDSVLRLAGVEDVESCRPFQAEAVQPRRLPDGLLEVFLRARPLPAWFLIEIATRAEQRVARQLAEDAMMVLLDRGELPEVVCLVLDRQGRLRVPRTLQLKSPLGHTHCRVKWTVVELWKIPAEALLATGDVGVVPWVPLCDVGSAGPSVLDRCREVIDQHAPPDEHENLLVVTAVLGSLRYNRADILRFLGVRSMGLEFPLLKWLEADTRQHTLQDVILHTLDRKFAEVPSDIAERVRSIEGETKLIELLDAATDCTDLASFQQHLP